MNKKLFSIASAVLLVSLFVISSSLSFAESKVEPKAVSKEVDKQKIISKVAQDWVKIGTKQYEKGFYSQAEKSLLRALDYQKYLSASDISQINDLLNKVKSANVSSSVIAENIEKGGQLLAEGKLLGAKACYEQAKGTEGISADQLSSVEEALKEIDEKIKQRTKAVTQIYKESVKSFDKGDYETARKGFLEVSKDELFKAEEGKSSEEYLAKIDAILVQRTEFPVLEEKKTEDANNSKAEENLLTEVATPASSEAEKEILVEVKDVNGVIEVVDINESAIDIAKVEAVETAAKPKLSVKESYSRAVVKSEVDNADKLTREGRFYHANKAVEKAYSVLEANKAMIGDELYVQYTKQLKVLSDMITAGRTEWLGETENKVEDKAEHEK